ncbi:hypothetical protein DFH09DRAFT_1075402 [Mycena vulgaris]|nr:hypothetical protein DFH09DRAFT_1075402 [Mycena vulgaris]
MGRLRRDGASGREGREERLVVRTMQKAVAAMSVMYTSWHDGGARKASWGDEDTTKRKWEPVERHEWRTVRKTKGRRRGCLGQVRYIRKRYLLGQRPASLTAWSPLVFWEEDKGGPFPHGVAESTSLSSRYSSWGEPLTTGKRTDIFTLSEETASMREKERRRDLAGRESRILHTSSASSSVTPFFRPNMRLARLKVQGSAPFRCGYGRSIFFAGICVDGVSGSASEESSAYILWPVPGLSALKGEPECLPGLAKAMLEGYVEQRVSGQVRTHNIDTHCSRPVYARIPTIPWEYLICNSTQVPGSIQGDLRKEPQNYATDNDGWQLEANRSSEHRHLLLLWTILDQTTST